MKSMIFATVTRECKTCFIHQSEKRE